MTAEAIWDAERAVRIGLAEAVMCQGKTVGQIASICETAYRGDGPVLLTRLDPEAFSALPADLREKLDYEPTSGTAILGTVPAPGAAAQIAVVTAGTADLGVAREAMRTLSVYGEKCAEIVDVGVAGLWRLLERVDEIKKFPIVIAVAGMDGAIFSVIGGLVPGAIIAVPTSTGYGASKQGETALNSALASCAPGVLVTNIDNGYGAACAAMRILKARSGKS
jgi:NCAIR mutase (PurE)-related protein